MVADKRKCFTHLDCGPFVAGSCSDLYSCNFRFIKYVLKVVVKNKFFPAPFCI